MFAFSGSHVASGLDLVVALADLTLGADLTWGRASCATAAGTQSVAHV